MEVIVSGQKRRALVDTGCSYTLVRIDSRLGEICQQNGEGITLETMDGKFVKTKGTSHIESLLVGGKELGPMTVQVMQFLPMGVDMIIGLDIVTQFGLVVHSGASGLEVRFINVLNGCIKSKDEIAQFGLVASLEEKRGVNVVSDQDFHAEFDGACWTASYIWKGNVRPNFAANKNKPNYKIPEEDKKEFNDEIKTWIDEGILVAWDEKTHGCVECVLPLMSIKQLKGDVQKVRPVLDFRILNENVLCLTGQSMPTCHGSLREWRTKGENCAVIDLRKAYLQVFVARELWVYQAVRWEGKMYLLTRLGFGLSVAPKIMTSIVQKVLSLDKSVQSMTSSYIDDIFVQGGSQEVKHVKAHLRRLGLESKEAERLGCKAGVRVLGLKVSEQLTWSRDNTLPLVSTNDVTRRELHSWIGELVSHFPVAGWLRVYCGYLQRCTAMEKLKWDANVGVDIFSKVSDIMAKLRDEGDPVKGVWPVDLQQSAVLWTDASSIAMGVMLVIDDKVVEDAAWLRSADDTHHINMAELEAAIRGVNLCVRWGVKKFTIKTDSATVFSWLKSVFEKTHRAKTRALHELLIRRRLDVLTELKEQENLKVTVEQVPSKENKADLLTRVPKKWFTTKVIAGAQLAAIKVDEVAKHEVEQIHGKHHFGVDRTLELARAKIGRRATRQITKEVIADCRQCASIDPAMTFRWEKGRISHGATWQRLAVDITHVNGRPYLSCIDCNSRYTIWRELRDESAREISVCLAQIFAEMGPPAEVFSDNGSIFRCIELQKLLKVWEVTTDNSCAYRAQGNGIVERVHRTIKRMVARSGRSVGEMAFWYNATRGEHPASPFERIFCAKPRMPGVTERREEVQRDWPVLEDQPTVDDTRFEVERNPFVVGEEVFLKQGSRCDKQWSGPHRVTDVKTSVSVTLDGSNIPRHVSHLRRVPVPHAAAEKSQEYAEDDDDASVDETEQPVVRPVRTRIQAQRFGMGKVTEPVYN